MRVASVVVNVPLTWWISTVSLPPPDFTSMTRKVLAQVERVVGGAVVPNVDLELVRVCSTPAERDLFGQRAA